jgi:hypothetical protein
LWAPLS